MKPVLLLAIVCAGLVPTAAQAAEPLIVPARGEWTLVKAGERCSLVRDFGDEGDLRLRIDSFGADTQFGFHLSGSLVPPSNDATAWITWSLSTDTGGRERREVLTGKQGRAPFVSFLGGFFPTPDQVDPALMAPGEKSDEQSAELRRIAYEAGDRVSSIGIEFARGRSLLIETGTMAEPIARLRGCIDTMLARWGVDPATQRSLSRGPRMSALTDAQLDQVLDGTSLAGGVAFVSVRARVDAYGKTSDCVVQTANTSESFENRLCAALANGFEPALNAQGQQVTSAFLLTILFGGR